MARMKGFINQIGRENRPRLYPSYCFVSIPSQGQPLLNIFVFHEEAVQVKNDDAIWIVCDKAYTSVHLVVNYSFHIKK